MPTGKVPVYLWLLGTYRGSPDGYFNSLFTILVITRTLITASSLRPLLVLTDCNSCALSFPGNVTVLLIDSTPYVPVALILM